MGCSAIVAAAEDCSTRMKSSDQWRRQLWGTEARAPPRLPTISF